MSPVSEYQEKSKLELKMYELYSAVTQNVYWYMVTSQQWHVALRYKCWGVRILPTLTVQKKTQRQAPSTQQEYQNTLDLHYFPAEFYTLNIWFPNAASPYKCYKCWKKLI